MSFPAVYAIILPAEGVYSNQAGDKGGETVFGITRGYDADAPIWPHVERLQAANTPHDQWNKDAPLMAAVSDFYRAKWNGFYMDQIPELLQGIIFGGIVNQGVIVVRMLQQALQFLGRPVVADGVLGLATVSAVAQVNPYALHGLLWEARSRRYAQVANANEALREDFLGWHNRMVSGA